MVDYIADYLENIRDRRVLPNVQPGYMSKLIPDSTPLEGEVFICSASSADLPPLMHYLTPLLAVLGRLDTTIVQ